MRLKKHMSVRDELGTVSSDSAAHQTSIFPYTVNATNLVTSTFQLPTEAVVGRVLTSDASGFGSWQTGGSSGPTSELVDPVTLFSGTANGIVTTGSGADPLLVVTQLTNGQLLVGSTSAAPVAAAITSSSSNVTVTGGAGTIQLGMASSPSFSGTVSAAAVVLSSGASVGNVLTCTSSGGASAWSASPPVSAGTNIQVAAVGGGTQVSTVASPTFSTVTTTAIGATGAVFVTMRSDSATITGGLSCSTLTASSLITQNGLDVVTTSAGAVTYSGTGSLTYNGPSVVITTPLITGAAQSVVQAFSFNNSYLTTASVVLVSICDYGTGTPFLIANVSDIIVGNCQVNVLNASALTAAVGPIQISMLIC